MKKLQRHIETTLIYYGKARSNCVVLFQTAFPYIILLSNKYMKRGRVCSQCLNIGTNPVCPFCLFKEFAVWINEQEIEISLKRIIMHKMKKYFALNEKINSFQYCIICHNLHGEICTPCFIRNSVYTLKKIKLNNEVLKNFILSFNQNKRLIWA